MDVLVKWLENPGKSTGSSSIDGLIDKLNQEIDSIESSIRDKLNLRDEEQFRDCFHDIVTFVGTMNDRLDQVNGELKAFEGDTGVKIKELREVLLQRNKQLSEVASKLSPTINDQAKDVVDQGIEGHHQDGEEDDDDDQLNLNHNVDASPTPSPDPVDQETRRRCDLTKQLAGDYVNEARKLVTNDLFPIVQIGDDVSQVLQSNSPTINQTLYSFPLCKVSQSIDDFVQLLRRMIKDARSRQDKEERYLLYQATRSVCELYLISLQLTHRKMISELHQYSAVFHNNCLFVAHQLLTLPMDYGLNDEEDFIVTFVDFVPALKESAYDAIIDQMKKHKHIIMNYLTEPDVTDALNASVNEDSTSRSLVPFYKALKKGLTHIGLIKKSWKDLLPISVCNKLIGTLVNCLIAGIVEAVLTLEDIPADTASKLSNILDGITKDIESLMDEFSMPFGQVIPKWLQFQEIKIILQASLRDIVDRWADGNGPLAVAFTPENVKSLIRSLFQNTERRSAALSRIR